MKAEISRLGGPSADGYRVTLTPESADDAARLSQMWTGLENGRYIQLGAPNVEFIVLRQEVSAG